MTPILRWLLMPIVVTVTMGAGIYFATDGTLKNHFHGSISDQSAQASIHPVMMDSGFELRQAIDTHGLGHVKQRLRESQACLWLRLEYAKNANWGSGTVLLQLSTDGQSWTTQVKSEQITTYFQPFCFEGSHAGDLLDRKTYLNISVIEPKLKNVAMIALGPANGHNNAVINGKISEYAATYNLTGNPSPSNEEKAVMWAMVIFTLSLLLTVLWTLTGSPTPSSSKRAQCAKKPLESQKI